MAAAARAQQPTVPVIGFLNPQSPDGHAGRLRGFRQGLKDAGFIKGENLAIEYCWAEGRQLCRQPAESPWAAAKSAVRGLSGQAGTA